MVTSGHQLSQTTNNTFSALLYVVNQTFSHEAILWLILTSAMFVVGRVTTGKIFVRTLVLDRFNWQKCLNSVDYVRPQNSNQRHMHHKNVVLNVSRTGVFYIIIKLMIQFNPPDYNSNNGCDEMVIIH